MNPEYTEEDYGEALDGIPASNKDHQPISVEVDFAPAEKSKTQKTSSRCIPRRFKTLTGREVEITEVGLIHPKYNGSKTLFMFDVTDGASDYRLSFNTETLEWFLEWEGDQYV